MEHLQAKCADDGVGSHPLIHHFIPTLKQGVCSTHPDKLPGDATSLKALRFLSDELPLIIRLAGLRMDGVSKHFFYRPSNAYGKGSRKRRMIQTECLAGTTWHKTGKSLGIKVNGRYAGWKKVLVLHTRSGDARYNTNWVMHQYHLGEQPEEKTGELVACKIFYKTERRTKSRTVR